MTYVIAAAILGVDEDDVLDLADELGISGEPTVADVAVMAEMLDENSDDEEEEED